MAKAEMKTRQNYGSVAEFITGVEPERRQEDAKRLLELFAEWTGWEASMWGSSIIGFGRYDYSYASGREGSFMVTGFSPRKAKLVLYIMPGYSDMSDELAQLGKHKVGKSCLYINKLADIDEDILRDIVQKGVADMKAKHPVFDI